MTYRSGLLTGIICTLCGVGVAAGAWWIVSRPPKTTSTPAAPAPAVIPHPLKEDQVNTVTLTAEAVERLDLQTAPVARQAMRPVRFSGGEVMIPAGRSIVVCAPFSGKLKAPPGEAPRPGQIVKRGQPLWDLLPLLTPEGRANLTSAKVDADGQVKSAETQLEAARKALDRAQRVFQSEAGSQRAVDEAQAQFDLAQKALAATTARRELLNKVVGEAETGTTAPLAIQCPEDGLLRSVSALNAQEVPAGAALFEVVNLERVWIRVPVYVGDLPEIDAAAPAQVGALTAHAGETQLPAQPAVAPPSANATAGTVDLVYELDNREARYSPGQRVGVNLALRSEVDSLTVPWSAVVHDIHGGTWVYEQTDERVFVRRRVNVRYVSGQTAVLEDGPASGKRVVSVGAVELFGAETGFTK